MGGISHVQAYRRRSAVRSGLNVNQVQRWLGHHSPSFTLDTYVHPLEEALPEPVSLLRELAHVGTGPRRLLESSSAVVVDEG